MAITFLCPACGAVATVSDESRGMSGVCGHCKLRLRVPTAIKFCVACHKDVAAEKRIKDPNGFYYCEPCYADRLAKKSAGPAKTPVAASAGVKLNMPSPERVAQPALNQDAAKPVEDLEEEVVSLDDLPIEGEMASRKRKAVAAISSGHQPVPAAPATPAAPVDDEFALADPSEVPPAIAAVAPAAKKAGAAPVESGEFALADQSQPPKKHEAPAPIPAASPKTAAAAPPLKTKELPAKCPNCGTPRIGKSFLCVGCQRDLRQMDNLIKLQQDDSEDKANRVAKIIGWSIAGVVITAVVLVVGWAVWVRVLDMMGPGKDVWPESASALTDPQKKDIEETFKHLQDVAAMVRVLSDGQKMQVNMMWWAGRPKDSKEELINKLSLYSQMHSGKADVVVVSESSNVTVAEKKGGKISIVERPVEPIGQ